LYDCVTVQRPVDSNYDFDFTQLKLLVSLDDAFKVLRLHEVNDLKQ
ncbi:1967_t:CDS:1, partial [Cetraspora pellucida]